MDSPLASRAVSPFGGWFQRWRQRVFHRDPTEHDQCLATRARLRAAVFLPYSRLVQVRCPQNSDWRALSQSLDARQVQAAGELYVCRIVGQPGRRIASVAL